MTRILRDTCRTQDLPVLETALAANGYAIEAAFQQAVGGSTTMLMRKGTVFLLFSHPPTGQLIDIVRPKLRRGSAIVNRNTLTYVLINLRALKRMRAAATEGRPRAEQ